MGIWNFYSTILACALSVQHVSALSPWVMSWSDETFGSDGPWHAVKVKIGSEDQQIALYPGGAWQSYILLSTLCDNTTDVGSYCYGDAAGLFSSGKSDTWDGDSISLSPDHEWTSLEWGYTNAVPLEGDAYHALDSIDVEGTGTSSSNLIAIEQGYQSYPGGVYPLSVGTLALGCPDANQSFSRTDEAALNGTFVTSYLYEHNHIPSYSYGMHIGSTKFGIPPSLYLGGYDKNRVLGDISTQPISSGKLPIEMLDISIEVSEGGSVWGTNSISGLMAKSNTSLSSGINVGIDATNPYIYLPQSTCDAITANLPVTYNSDFGLYTWDTDNENYTKVITSPSSLAFNFVMNDVNTQNITINVPFALLNLTLSAPYVKTDTPYLPLFPTDSDPLLGRAFLQAAFYGVHWSEAVWFLAQAPGPDYNFVAESTNIEPTDTNITGSQSSWEQTWASYWTVLSDSVTETNSSAAAANTTAAAASSSSDSSSGLSTGAKAGIGAGVGCAGLIVLILAAWFFLRRRKNADVKEQQQQQGLMDQPYRQPPMHTPVEIASSGGAATQELDHESSNTGYLYGNGSSQMSASGGHHSSTAGSVMGHSTVERTVERYELSN